ncbi:MAG: hypothetical protein FWD29_01225 [Micrococcales bacterium]|nr:hypothetical protein [Micrococcales bacterium]
MIELPEAQTLAGQLRATLTGRRVEEVVAGASPHKFAFFNGDPAAYGPALMGRTFTDAQSYGGMVELMAGEMSLVFHDGINLRWLAPSEVLPAKHQLLVGLDDGSTLLASVQMYGGLWLAQTGQLDSPYYQLARSRPCPLTEAFDRTWFDGIVAEAKPTLSAKALLATEQRIPGLGNGVLQDILFRARVHPRTKINTLSAAERGRLFNSVKTTLAAMAEAGGRNTEKDLFSSPGGYQTLLSAKTYHAPCPSCGGGIVRAAYLGGNVYFCPTCQPQP